MKMTYKKPRQVNSLKISIYMKYFALFYLTSLILPNDIFCLQPYYPNNLNHRKRSDSLEASQQVIPPPNDKGHLKEALELLNLGKKTLGLRTESPEILMQLVQNSNGKAKSSYIHRILQEPQNINDRNVGKQYLVLTGKNGRMRVDNFTNVTLSPQEEIAANKDGNMQEVFKMEMEKKAPFGKENIFHKITIIETNKQLPYAGHYFSPSKSKSGNRRKRHKGGKPYHYRQKRDDDENFHSTFMRKKKSKTVDEDAMIGEDFDGDHEKRDTFSSNDIVNSETQASDIKSEGSESSQSKFQHLVSLKDKDVYSDDIQQVETNRDNATTNSGIPLQRLESIIVDRPSFEWSSYEDENKVNRKKNTKGSFSAFQYADEVQSKRGGFKTKYSGNRYVQLLRRGFLEQNFNNVRRNHARRLAKWYRPAMMEDGTGIREDNQLSDPAADRMHSTDSNNFKREYFEENIKGKNEENKMNDGGSDTSFNNTLLTTSTHSSLSTQYEDRASEIKMLKTHKTTPFSEKYFLEDIFKYKSHAQANKSDEIISIFPFTFLGQPAFQNRLLPIRYEGHLIENIPVGILGVTSMISVVLLCFVTGLLVYRKCGRKDHVFPSGTLKLKGTNVIVKLSDGESNHEVKNCSKQLMKMPLFTPYLKGIYYNSLANEEDQTADLEWQSELGEWLSDSDLTR